MAMGTYVVNVSASRAEILGSNPHQVLPCYNFHHIHCLVTVVIGDK
jgi:hypothetical protein